VKANYASFIARLISRYEGGYGWDRADPGGPTKYGITCYDLAEHRHQTMHSMAAWAPIVRTMNLGEAEAIYRRKYASRLRFDELPSGIDCVVLDYGINSGTARPVKVLRAIFKKPGGVVLDNILLDEIKAADPVKLINAICDERLGFMKRIRNGTAWATFGKGWSARVADLRRYGNNLARGIAQPVSKTIPARERSKATNVDPKLNKKAATGTVIASGGAIGSVTTGLSTGVVVLIVVAVIFAGVLFVVWQRNKAKKADAKVVLPENLDVDHTQPQPGAV